MAGAETVKASRSGYFRLLPQSLQNLTSLVNPPHGTQNGPVPVTASRHGQEQPLDLVCGRGQRQTVQPDHSLHEHVGSTEVNK